jgi:hypothetical protein
MLFSIIAGAVIWECEHQFFQTHPNRLQYIDILFYADDGMIAGENPQDQDLLDRFTATFARVGLKMNADKWSR